MRKILMESVIMMAKRNCFQRFDISGKYFCSCDQPMETSTLLESVRTLLLCSMRCSQSGACVAFNFWIDSNQCQLFNRTIKKFSFLPKCQYYFVKGGLIAKTADNYIQTNSSWKCTDHYYDGWYENSSRPRNVPCIQYNELEVNRCPPSFQFFFSFGVCLSLTIEVNVSTPQKHFYRCWRLNEEAFNTINFICTNFFKISL
ncbi:hypothetical protein HELRODRAFT_160762 [Helobdella robusta]|uniref:Apple domain-containing protein n=1 Tax=Helobdella robusta TaxID=6412 RepID=T1EQP7_HELRO|nr:hypothetical protein HELRODRAFT_160762 [Helobdella robusta]ESO06579.1 hypothetical protein HELRODRAFT_160762 [Helobdella robusta]